MSVHTFREQILDAEADRSEDVLRRLAAEVVDQEATIVQFAPEGTGTCGKPITAKLP